jgi:hypothetical protein
MTIKCDGNLLGEPFDLFAGSFRVKVDSSVRKVLDIPGDVKPPGHSQDLSPEAYALDVAGIPDIAMRDMG